MKNLTYAALAHWRTCRPAQCTGSRKHSRHAGDGAEREVRSAALSLKGGDFHTSSAGLYLKTASEGGFSEPRATRTEPSTPRSTSTSWSRRAMFPIRRVVSNPQNAAAWYYMGRSDLMLGDVRGADSSFTRLEKLSPDCAEAIKQMRQTAWIALVTPSTQFMRDAQNDSLPAATRKANIDSAFCILRDANTISTYYPQGFYNMAGTFMINQQYDSAMVYLKLALEKSGDDPQFATTTKPATANLARLYERSGDYPNAEIYWQKYLKIDPNDVEAKRGLAIALRKTGKNTEAAAVEGQLMTSGALSSHEVMGVGVRHFQAKDYAAAAEDFQRVLTMEPGNHDALYNLANTYLGLKDGKKLVETAQKLLDVDPLGVANLQLLFNGYRLAADTNKQIDVYTRLMRRCRPASSSTHSTCGRMASRSRELLPGATRRTRRTRRFRPSH